MNRLEMSAAIKTAIDVYRIDFHPVNEIKHCKIFYPLAVLAK